MLQKYHFPVLNRKDHKYKPGMRYILNSVLNTLRNSVIIVIECVVQFLHIVVGLWGSFQKEPAALPLFPVSPVYGLTLYEKWHP